MFAAILPSVFGIRSFALPISLLLQPYYCGVNLVFIWNVLDVEKSGCVDRDNFICLGRLEFTKPAVNNKLDIL